MKSAGGWMRAPCDEAKALQQPFLEDAFRIVMGGKGKKDFTGRSGCHLGLSVTCSETIRAPGREER